MKKTLFFLPIFGLLLSGCSLEDLTFWNKNQDGNSSQKDDEKGSGDTPAVEEDIPVKSVSLNKTTLTLEEMQSEKLTYTILPTNATNKDVEWSTSDGVIASVVDGTVYANNPGTATITVSSVDGNKTSSCEVHVTAKQIDVETITRSICFDDKKPTSGSGYDITEPFTIDSNITATFSIGEGSTNPRIWQNPNKSSEYDARLYTGNTLVISSSSSNIRNIEFTFGREDNSSVTMISTDGRFSESTWSGNSNEVTFKVTGNGHRRITQITVEYEGSDPVNVPINLGVKSIAEVREYIANNPVEKNEFGNGVNEYRTVTIKGFALAKINLEKSVGKYGLDVSEFGKVIMADSTGYIGVASKVSKDGTTLYGKVGSYTCTDTARYSVTGYLSEYLGHPEIMVTSFTWDQTLDVSWDASVLSDANVTIDNFYNKAKDVYYNCAGHGYGEVLTLTNLKLYYTETDGQNIRYYNFTDGVKNIRVNAYNIGSFTVGKYYDVVGITSIKNLSPIIVAFRITETENPDEFNFNFGTASQSTELEDLYTIHGSQDDVDTRTTRFDDVIEAYGNFYKTTGYLTLVEQGGLYYVGISKTYLSNITLDNPISGKDNACTNYGVTLIKNDDFWGAEASELVRYNPFYEYYVCENHPIQIYYTLRQQRYVSSNPIWEILLIQDSLYVY